MALGLVVASACAGVAGLANSAALAWAVTLGFGVMTARYAYLTTAALHGEGPVADVAQTPRGPDHPGRDQAAARASRRAAKASIAGNTTRVQTIK